MYRPPRANWRAPEWSQEGGCQLKRPTVLSAAQEIPDGSFVAVRVSACQLARIRSRLVTVS
jgi:hypothetical protein